MSIESQIRLSNFTKDWKESHSRLNLWEYILQKLTGFSYFDPMKCGTTNDPIIELCFKKLVLHM